MHASIIASIAALAVGTIAGPIGQTADRTVEARHEICGTTLGSCYANGCLGIFVKTSDTEGICSAGTYNGCPCSKCGNYVGSCTNNDCFGITGVCTTGPYQGCDCN